MPVLSWHEAWPFDDALKNFNWVLWRKWFADILDYPHAWHFGEVHLLWMHAMRGVYACAKPQWPAGFFAEDLRAHMAHVPIPLGAQSYLLKFMLHNQTKHMAPPYSHINFTPIQLPPVSFFSSAARARAAELVHEILAERLLSAVEKVFKNKQAVANFSCVLPNEVSDEAVKEVVSYLSHKQLEVHTRADAWDVAQEGAYRVTCTINVAPVSEDT